MFVLKNLFLYLILTLFIIEGTIESIKLMMDTNEIPDLALELEKEDTEKEKEKEENKEKESENFLEVTASLQKRFDSNLISLIAHDLCVIMKYENVSTSVPTPPPDKTLA